MIDQITPAWLATLQSELPNGRVPERLELPHGTRRHQTEQSQLCTAHMALAAAESAGLPHHFRPELVLERARSNMSAKLQLQRGAFLIHSFLTVQQMIGNPKARIISFRMITGDGLESVMHPSQQGQIAWESIKLWLAAKRTMVAISMDYFEQDHRASDGVLLGGMGRSGNHAMGVYGYEKMTYYRHRVPLLPIRWGKRTEECALVRNTLWPDERQGVPTRRLYSTVHLSEALAFHIAP